MGLIDALAGGVSAAAKSAGDYYGKAAIAEELSRLEEQKQMRIAEATHGRALADETRKTDKNKAIYQRGGEIAGEGVLQARGAMAERAGLDDAEYRGDEGVGVNVQSGAPVQVSPEARRKGLIQASMEAGDPASALTYEKMGADERAASAMASKERITEKNNFTKEMIADKRFAAMLQAATVRASRGEAGGKDPSIVATAEWLVENKVAKDPAEAWKMANQQKASINEKVTTDAIGNVTIHSPDTGEITRIDPEGKSSTVRAAKGAAQPAEDAPPPSALKSGVNTKFKNGQVWTIENGKPKRVQ